MLWQNADHLADRDCEIRKTKQGEKRAYIPKHWKGKSQITWRRSADWPHVLTPGKIYYTMARVNFYLWLLFTFFGGHFSCSNKPLLVKYHVTFCQGPNDSKCSSVFLMQEPWWCRSHPFSHSPSFCTPLHEPTHLPPAATRPLSILQVVVVTPAKPTGGDCVVSSRRSKRFSHPRKDTGYLKEMIPLKRCTEIVIQLKKLGWHCFTTNMSNEDLPNGFHYKRLDIGLSWWKMT